VISQINSSNARPIPQSSSTMRDVLKGFPHGGCRVPQRRQQSARVYHRVEIKMQVRV
jgi:hypothetical protein